MILASEGDVATRIFFPIGRFFTFLIEHPLYRDDQVQEWGNRDERFIADHKTIGNYKPFRTHRLAPAPVDTESDEATATFLSTVIDRKSPEYNELCSMWEEWSKQDSKTLTVSAVDKDGKAQLYRFTRTDGGLMTKNRQPLMISRVDKSILSDHKLSDGVALIDIISKFTSFTTAPLNVLATCQFRELNDLLEKPEFGNLQELLDNQPKLEGLKERKQ